MDQQITSINATSLADVSAFHHDFYGASQGELAIVSDFDVAAVAKMIQDEFGTWQSATPYARLIRHNFYVAPMQKTINSQDKENGFYVARLNLDMRDDDADYPAMMVANYLFGGGGLK